MKSNYVKSLLITLGIAGLFTSFYTSANFVLSGKPCYSGIFPSCSSTSSLYIRNNSIPTDYNNINYLNYYYLSNQNENAGGYYTLNTGNNIVNGNLSSHNDGDNLVYGYVSSSNRYFPKLTYSFVKLESNGDTLNYCVWVDKDKEYSCSVYGGIPNNGSYNDLTYEYYSAWHDSFVFYNAGYLSGLISYQLIGNQRLENRIIYVDTLETNQNVWLIDLPNMVAWSMSVSDSIELSNWLFGYYDFSDNSFINSQNWTHKYVISISNGGDSFFPKTSGNHICNSSSNLSVINGGVQSCRYANIGLNYSSDIFTSPNYEVNNGNNGSNGSGDQITIDYLKCVDTYTSIGNMAKLINSCNNSCNSQGNDNSCGDYFFYMNNYTGTGSYTGSIDSVSCRDMLNYANSFYIAANSDLEIYHDRLTSAFNYADRGVDIDPVSICSAYASEDQKYEMLNFFEKIQYQFSSGYNYFNVPSCSDNYMGKSYAWGNYLLIFVAGRILFILFSVF